MVHTDTGGVINDRLFSDVMSDLAASLSSDWVIRVDADELVYPRGGALGGVDPRASLAAADGNTITTTFHWVYRHRSDTDLNPGLPAVPQRRHGGAYTIWPGMGPTFTKPNVVRPSSGIRWRPGEQGHHPGVGNVVPSRTGWEGVHWQMVDVDEAVRRLLSAEARLSDVNKKNNWGVRRFTEPQIRAFCSDHLDDPEVIR